ncbi:MAG: galactokinase [Balneola sp.]|nr:MAG: galactokinase [Balneola sp.]
MEMFDSQIKIGKHIVGYVAEAFTNRFDGIPTLIKSPGRVNIIGEHVDYNDGFVLPATINKHVVFAIAANDTSVVNLVSLDLGEKESIDLNNLQIPPKYQWTKYIQGALLELGERGYSVAGFDVVFGGNIPIGAGVSSSAALEGGLLTGLSHLFSLDITKKEIAMMGKDIEHNHIGVQCGIMDQFINVYGQKDGILKLDCRDLSYDILPFENRDVAIVLCNSMVSHNLYTTQYNKRRKQCAEAVSYFKKFDPQIKKLRDVSIELFNSKGKGLSPDIQKRTKFVIEEIERVHTASDLILSGEIDSLGEKLIESHLGLSKEYEVSCLELDLLVDIAVKQNGVLGARMMGGGFGGCTLNLVMDDSVESFKETITDKYRSKTQIDPELYVMKIDEGVHIIEG